MVWFGAELVLEYVQSLCRKTQQRFPDWIELSHYRMLLRYSLLLSLFFLIAAQDLITGRYMNDAGDEMELFCSYSSVGESASLAGWYYPKTGNNTGTYTLSGQSTGCGPTVQLSFSVAWRNPSGNNDSATAWIAQATSNGSGNSVDLYAMWLMTGGRNAQIGADWFFYYAPTTSS